MRLPPRRKPLRYPRYVADYAWAFVCAGYSAGRLPDLNYALEVASNFEALVVKRNEDT